MIDYNIGVQYCCDFHYRWAIIKDEAVYQKMLTYLDLNTMGVSREAQLRALKLLNVVLEGGGKEIFQFGYTTMRDRWIRLKQILSQSTRFSLQKLSPQYCSFFKRVRDPSPGICHLRKMLERWKFFQNIIIIMVCHAY